MRRKTWDEAMIDWTEAVGEWHLADEGAPGESHRTTEPTKQARPPKQVPRK